MWRSVASNFLTILIVALVVGVGLIAWGQREYVGPGPLDRSVCVRVDQGQRFRPLADELASDGVISSARIFRIGAEYSEKSDDLKAGSFLVPEAASMETVLDLVTRGGASTCGTEVVLRVGVAAQEIEVRELDPETERFEEVAAFDPAETEAPANYTSVRGEPDTRYRVALAEGVTSWRVVEALKAADFLAGEVADVPEEGRLAPDSDEVTDGSERGALLAEMGRRQDQRLAEAWANRVEGLPVTTPEEALILASIIEKETGIAEERPTVASVFVNRLNQGMRLQTDPTVIYGVTEGRGVLGRGLRQSELRAETPWNTYVIDGLPETPIANPGIESLQAAVDPAETDYLFFVADGTGGHVFAETLDEHNANVAEWRAIEAERAQTAEDGAAEDGAAEGQ